MGKRHYDSLLIVAHPDDDALFGGALQLSQTDRRWGVVCATYSRESLRGSELMAWQLRRGLAPEDVHFLGFEDVDGDWKNGVSSFTRRAARDALSELAIDADCVYTHNCLGEYGHPHHIVVHEAVVDMAFPRTDFFAAGLPCWDEEHRVEDTTAELLLSYPSQRTSIAKVVRRYGVNTIARIARRETMERVVMAHPSLRRIVRRPARGVFAPLISIRNRLYCPL